MARGATAPADRGAGRCAELQRGRARGRARRRGRARGGRAGAGPAPHVLALLPCSQDPKIHLKNQPNYMTAPYVRARAHSRRHTAHTVCRAEHLSHDMDHTQTVTVNSLSRHSLLTQRDAQPAHRPPPAGGRARPGGHDVVCPTPTGKMPRGSRRRSIEAPR